MKKLSFLLLAAAFLSAQTSEPEKLHKLMSVTYNLIDHRLRWDVAEGYRKSAGGEFVISKLLEQAEIDPDDCVMKVGERTKKFGAEEGKQLHALLDTLAEYAAESSMWFDADDVADSKATVARR